MKWDELEEEPCSLARTVAVIGDRWTLLIVRECFLRTRRFEGFQSALGITRHLLAERLKKLVRLGVLRRIPYQDSPKRHEYILTQKGLDLYPIIMSIVHWGDTHMVDERGRPLLHEHKSCGKMFDPVLICSECGEPVTARDVHVHPGPGKDSSPLPPRSGGEGSGVGGCFRRFTARGMRRQEPQHRRTPRYPPPPTPPRHAQRARGGRGVKEHP